MTGALYVLAPVVPVPFDLTNPATLMPFQLARIPFSIPVIPSGGLVSLTMPVTPPTSFIAATVIDFNSAETDLQLLNNAYYESFLEIPVLSFASPYQPLSITQKVTNMTKGDSLVAFTMDLPNPIPEGWKLAEMKNPRMLLKSGESDEFRLTMLPPSPDIMKPGQIGKLATTAWQNSGDSFIPVMDIPRYFLITASTAVSLKATGGGEKYELSGELVQISEGEIVESIAGQRLNITITRQTSDPLELVLTTDDSGRFSTSLLLDRPEETHAAIVQFPGTQQFAQSLSEPVVFHEGVEAKGQLQGLQAVWRGRALYLVATLSGRAREDIVLEIVSSDARLAKAAPIRISAGAVQGETQVQFAAQARSSVQLTFSTNFENRRLTATLPRFRPGAHADIFERR